MPLLAVLIAAGLSQTIAPDPLFAQPLLGIVLLIVLFSFDREGYRDMAQSLAFGAVAGYCATRVVLPVLAYLGIGGLGLPWFSIVWIVATLILWAVDISRMGRRAAAAQSYLAGPVIPQAAPVVVPSPLREEPVRAQPVAPPPPPPPAPVFAPAPVRPTSVTSIFSQPPMPARAVEEAAAPPPSPIPLPTPPPAPVMPAPVMAPSVAPVPAAPVPAAPVPVTPAPALAVPQGSGKPATIYLNLVGEGLPCLRSVQAEHVGKDYYLIVEPVPAGEAWQFQPGQVVRCQKRNLSNGKAMVAVEEAPRAS